MAKPTAVHYVEHIGGNLYSPVSACGRYNAHLSFTNVIDKVTCHACMTCVSYSNARSYYRTGFDQPKDRIPPAKQLPDIPEWGYGRRGATREGE